MRLIVGFAAGGPTDVFARVLADLLSARWVGTPVIVENRPGAGTILATTAVAKSPPDGYTLLVAAGDYNGSASALTDVIGGRVPLMFDAWQSSKPYVDGGQLKLIATTGVNRLRDAPQAPTIAETYPGFSANPFSFVLGPAGIPEPILHKLSADLRAVVDSPEFAAKMLPLGTDPKSSSPQELRLLI